ncbi:uncharacterized protein si:dkeyp-97a10.3 isoform X1 [Cyclopterus lumpus]|uniref:uncharacterized protein si:dkeyp-97a10.3 isoform X1 n=1 Tax=Cyclopterus lumpus TaxID=8103 RepID=UPI0014875300|nr:uncharacterized protein si:dkeyp-97a10.3 isoform X1 [Cyclopterus lumpus]
MRQPLLLLSLSLAVLLSANVLAQNQIEIQFQTDPVLVQTGAEIVFTVLTVSQVFSMTWQYQGGVTVGQWSGGSQTINTGTQFQDRITITNTQLRIVGAQLRDAGKFTVVVTPTATTGLVTNSRSIQLRVFDAVATVTLLVPSVAVEARNVSLRCTWTGGTDITVRWGKGGAAILADDRITISAGSLVINPARRSDAGEYTCTVSNPISAQTATESLTVYYGPDIPVLTKVSPKECVGGGDVLVGQTVRLTCVSDSLPPALFSWQRDGQPVASVQPDSGVLSLQTFSTDESGPYVCTARNGLTGGTSQQGVDLAIVATCLDVGEVVGIVIGCLLLILIIVLLIVLIVCLARRRRAQQRQSDTSVKTNPNPGPIPPDPQPNGARDLGHGPHPPLYHLNTHTHHPDRIYAAPPESRGNPQTLQLNGVRNSNTHQHNGRTHTNGLLHNASQNANSYRHNGIDNRAFTHNDSQNANTLPNTQQQNPNILIQTGTNQGGAQPSAVHVSLNTLPQTPQQNNNAQIPTIHVNLNSYPNTSQQTQGDNSFPLTNTTQQNVTQTGQLNPRMQSGQSYPSNIEAGHQDQPGLVPTGYTHYHSNNSPQRNANTQTYQQEPEPHRRSDRNSWDLLRGTPAYTPQQNANTETYQQEPEPHRRSDRNSWDLLRGTPAYPSGTPQRGQTSPEYTSDYTDNTTHPPIRELRTPNRSQPRPQSQNTSRSRALLRQDAPLVDRRTRSRSANLQGPNTLSVTQLEAERHAQRSGHTQREGAQRDIRGSSGSHTAPRQETTHNNNPRALTLMSQQASVGRSALPQGPMTRQGPTADSRALADPNHLPQAHMALQHRAVLIQTPPQGPGKLTHPVTNGANQPRQGGTAPVPQSSAQLNPSNLTQAALTAHTERAQTFQNRKQQTQAALLHPVPQARVPAAAAQHAPTPPPVIPLAQFQALPKKQHKSPTRGLQPPRPPVNIPVAQRPGQVQQRHANHHHHPENGTHRHARGHGHPSHFTHPQQHQAPRGRPR